MTVVDAAAFKPFPTEAKVSLRLVENKRVEVVDLGTIGKLRTSRDLQSRGFVAPSCQLRIADPGTHAKGMLLASTDNWTLRGDDEDQLSNSQGILQFLADDTAPQSWKLELKESDRPLVRVDRRIPNAAMWARNDPVFVGTALPAIVSQIFEAILNREFSDDLEWVTEWLKWADSFLPGEVVPFGEERATRSDYIERLLDSFCARHNLSESLLAAAQPKDSQ
jgi:hypothetical protein